MLSQLFHVKIEQGHKWRWHLMQSTSHIPFSVPCEKGKYYV